jgi:hypothetical protein
VSFITFNTIGESGNLGSQLQQYASLYAVAKENQKQIVFSESSIKAGFGFKFAELLDIPIVIKPDEFFKDFLNVQPDDRQIKDRRVFELDPSININISNRFDLFHYWYPKYQEEVLAWEWNTKHLKAAGELYKQIPCTGKETVAVHVRRGDYLLPQHNHFCKLGINDYYSPALGPYFEKADKYHFVIFSNDIDWCKTYLIEEHESVTFIEPGLDYVDLILMSLCDHNITANSSYSWWSAFKNRNKNKMVTCPMNYLKSNSPWSHINSNYYPETWKAINNTSI